MFNFSRMARVACLSFSCVANVAPAIAQEEKSVSWSFYYRPDIGGHFYFTPREMRIRQHIEAIEDGIENAKQNPSQKQPEFTPNAFLG